MLYAQQLQLFSFLVKLCVLICARQCIIVAPFAQNAGHEYISKITNISWPFGHFSLLFHSLKREKTEKDLKGEKLLHCWSISIMGDFPLGFLNFFLPE